MWVLVIFILCSSICKKLVIQRKYLSISRPVVLRRECQLYWGYCLWSKKHTFYPFQFWQIASVTRGNKSIWLIKSIWGLHNMHMCRCLWVWMEQPKPISMWGKEKNLCRLHVTVAMSNCSELCISSNTSSTTVLAVQFPAKFCLKNILGPAVSHKLQ